MTKYIAWIIAIFGFAWLFFSSCDDYVERGIEGMWQMKKIIKTDGSEEAVDTLYYSFKKGLFKYTYMEDDLNAVYHYGNYEESDGKLIVEIGKSICLIGNCDRYPLEESDSDKVKWVFEVKKRTSSTLELMFNDELLLFRKY